MNAAIFRFCFYFST
ncbi:pheST operon leader peptide PheM [Escherichia coli]